MARELRKTIPIRHLLSAVGLVGESVCRAFSVCFYNIFGYIVVYMEAYVIERSSGWG